MNRNQHRQTAPSTEAGLTVGATAEALGTSVRTLHHWDEIGLVSPGSRTSAGYRLYSRADISRLQQVLVYREVGMPLETIAEVLAAPGTDEVAHLTRQRALLLERITRLEEMVSSVDDLLEMNMNHEELSPTDQATALGSRWSDPYAAQAEERWGDTDAWKQSQRVLAEMSDEDMQRAKAQNEEMETALAVALREGVTPGSPAANELAEWHRSDIGRWFTMSHSRQVLIARGYTEDPRFRQHYDSREPGLAQWLREVIDANARDHGVNPDNAEWG